MAALTGNQSGRFARAAVGAALACFYLALCLIRPGEMGLGDLLTELGWRSPQPADVTERCCFPSLRAVSGARHPTVAVLDVFLYDRQVGERGGHRWGNPGCGM